MAGTVLTQEGRPSGPGQEEDDWYVPFAQPTCSS